MLPYSVDEIYCLKNSGYYQNTRQTYNSMHQVYPEKTVEAKIKPSVILTEDSNSGYDMYKEICRDKGILCQSAEGKSNIAGYLLANKEEAIFAVVDGAAFGTDMRNVMHALKINKKSCVWTPESFEYFILQSGIVEAEGLHKIMENPGEYIDGGKYSSWERFLLGCWKISHKIRFMFIVRKG